MSKTYSILYSDPEGDIFYAEHAVDWNWMVPRQWTISNKEIGGGWYPEKKLNHRAYRVLLEHFGLDYYEVSLERIIFMSPAELTAHRREKEEKYGLERKEIINQRLGDHQPAEVFN